MKTERIAVSELVEDFDLYPRANVDSGHIAQIVVAMEAGATLPPIIVEAKTKRIVDGFHRCRAARRFLGDTAEIEAEMRTYKSEADLFIDAMSLNAGHGRNMTSYDRTTAIEKALRMEIDPAIVAGVLHMKVERVTQFKQERCAKMENSRRLVPLKMPVRHLVGQTMTREQSEVMPKLGGNQQTFYVNQLILLIEQGLLDRENEQLMDRLGTLKKLLNKL